MSLSLLLGLALLATMIVLAILFGTHVQTFDGTIADMVAAIGAFIGAKEIVNGTTNNQTSH